MKSILLLVLYDLNGILVQFKALEKFKHEILNPPIFWNQFLILYIVSPKSFIVSRSLLHCAGNNLGDYRSALKWPWLIINFDVSQDLS